MTEGRKKTAGTYGELTVYDRKWKVSKFCVHNRFIVVRTTSVFVCVCVCRVEVSCTRQPGVECGINGKVTQRLEVGGVEGGRRGGFEMQE